MAKKVIVIGGGIGGLSGAIRLAKLGYKVDLYEQNRSLGGKMGRIHLDGYTFDSGPTLLTMPFVIEDLFQFVGKKSSDYVQVIPIEPICRYFFENEDPFEASSDIEIMQKNITRQFKDDPKNYLQFLKYAERIYQKTSPVFIFSPIHEFRKMLKWEHLARLLTIYQIDPFRTVHQAVKRHFKDPHLIQLFDRYPTYNGSDPYRAPATLNVIPYVELGIGSYYIKGGLYQLILALVKIARELNINIFTEKKVERILHDNHRIKGVKIQGEKIDGNLVLCNCDVVVSFNDLIDGFQKSKNRLNRLEPSLSGLIFFWGVNQKHSQLKQHNIIFSKNYEREFRQIFRNLTPPDDPTIYISISSKWDPEHAPVGCENWFVLINMPYLNDSKMWGKSKIDEIRQVIFRKLRYFGMELEGKIDCELIITPLDIVNKFCSNRGSIYGISSNSLNSAFRRPANRSRQLEGLYFCGGSTHPGGGVPMCMTSGKIAAELINEFHKN